MSSLKKNEHFSKFFTDRWREMVKEILSADNNLHIKINATLSSELLLEETSDSFHL